MTKFNIPSNPTRFTHGLVDRVQLLLLEHASALSVDARRFVQNSLQIGGSLGHGTRYIGFGGSQRVEYGGYGARAALMYFYGIGAAMGVWFNPVMEGDLDVLALADITRSLGDFDEFRIIGHEYATRYGFGVTFVETD